MKHENYFKWIIKYSGVIAQSKLTEMLSTKYVIGVVLFSWVQTLFTVMLLFLMFHPVAWFPGLS